MPRCFIWLTLKAKSNHYKNLAFSFFFWKEATLSSNIHLDIKIRNKLEELLFYFCQKLKHYLFLLYFCVSLR